MPAERELISKRNFLRQLRLELEYELLSDLDVRRTRELRRAVRAAVEKAATAKLPAQIDEAAAGILESARADVEPVVEAIRQRRRPEGEEHWFQRTNLSVRLQHGMMALSVIMLILTGLPLKFPDNPLFIQLMGLLGGINNSTFIHRVGAVGLIMVSLWHLVYITAFRDGRRDFLLMLPRWKDMTDFFHNILYFLGRKTDKPRFGRFSYVEKFDYWAVYWGCVIMIGTGILLWSPTFTFAYFPKYIYDIAKEVHSDEALLATLAIVIWHFYNVHFNPAMFPGSLRWFHGRISEHEMIEEHPLEYAEITAREAAAAGSGREAGQ